MRKNNHMCTTQIDEPIIKFGSAMGFGVCNVALGAWDSEGLTIQYLLFNVNTVIKPVQFTPALKRCTT